MVRCLQFKQDNGEPAELYQLDDDQDAMQFFHYLSQAVEPGDEFEIKIVDLTPDEWAEAVKIGEELS
jgi:hypothetical protein